MIRGQEIPAHKQLWLGLREAEALRTVVSEAVQDPQFNLNEFEEEVCEKVVELLEST